MPTDRSPPLDDALIDEFLSYPESYHFDCKRLKDKLTKLLETVVAFANSDGGTIALGFEDPDKATGRKRIFGIQENLANWDELRRLLQSRITEPNMLVWQAMEIGCTLQDDKLGSVIFLRIEKSTRIHSIVDDGTWVRFDTGNKQLTAIEINNLCFARGTISAENQLEHVEFELLETSYWRSYARQRQLTRPIAEAMQHLGLSKRDSDSQLHPTRAAVLLFAEEPSGLLGGKAAIRVFHYRGNKIQADPNTNLLKPPRTVSGPLIRQIQEATEFVVQELASGIQMGALGFDIVQKYPLRVIKEALTNAVIHRDYRLNSDIHVRIFSDRIEVESPGLLVGPVTVANIPRIGTHSRNPLLINSLREFPSPPNLDAGEGVRMMFGTMREAGLYPPLYATQPRIERESVVVYLLNENRPSVWEQVNDFIDKRGSIVNSEVRKLMVTADTLAASKQIRDWVNRGLLFVMNPHEAKQHRRYSKPGGTGGKGLFSKPHGKDQPV